MASDPDVYRRSADAERALWAMAENGNVDWAAARIAAPSSSARVSATWAGKAPAPEEYEREPEFFADWFPPGRSGVPGLAPGQDRALTEAEPDRAAADPGGHPG